MKTVCKIPFLIFFLVILTRSMLIAQDNDFDKILWTADWSPDGKYIAVGGNHDSLKIFSGKTFKRLKTYPIRETITKVKWHPSKNLLAIATQGEVGKVLILDFDLGQFTSLNNGIFSGARGLDWNHNGQYLAVGDGEGVVHLFTQNAKHLRSIEKEDTKSYTTLSWHPSENIFVVASSKVRLYDIEGNAIKVFKHRAEEVLILCTDWHPSGDFFALGDYGDNIQNHTPLLQFFNAEGSTLESVEGSKAEYRTLAWHKSGKVIATASDALRIWNKEGILLAESPSFKGNLWGLDWNPKGNRIITTSGNGKVQIWNKKAKLLRTLE